MADKIVLKSEETQSLQDFQTQFSFLTNRYGQLRFQQKLVEKEMLEVDSAMATLEQKRAEFFDQLQSVYGIGQVNLNTGEFTPESA